MVAAPTVLIEEPAVMYETEYLYTPADYGIDNYGNKLIEHPYAHLNDEKGTWAIEAELIYAEQRPAHTSTVQVPHHVNTVHQAPVV